jgi:hypothetical protein
MSKFVTKTIQEVQGRQIFKQLILIDDHVDTKKLQEEIDKIEADEDQEKRKVEHKGVMDTHEELLEHKYKSAFTRILGNMNRAANLQALPKEKFKDVTTNKSLATEYEYKFGDLRVWSIKIPNGQLIIHCGYKNSQKGDFREFRGKIKQYLESLK